MLHHVRSSCFVRVLKGNQRTVSLHTKEIGVTILFIHTKNSKLPKNICCLKTHFGHQRVCALKLQTLILTHVWSIFSYNPMCLHINIL